MSKNDLTDFAVNELLPFCILLSFIAVKRAQTSSVDKLQKEVA